MERIQKILAHGGIASRRAAEQLILAGRVRVNGKVVTELGAKANPRHDRVEVDGKRVVAEELVYVVLHKPRGVVSTMADPEGRPTVKELLESIPGRVYPVGRLDFATSGVLLATNDGELADGLLHPRKAVPKTYVLKVKGVMKPEDLEQWRKGVRLEDGMTQPADAKLLRHEGDKTWLELTIREGRNQQIRRMGEATGFPVMRLARVAFAEVSAEGLAPGRWRHLTRDELVELRKTYGVPRSLPSAPEQEAGARKIQAKPVFVRGAARGAAGRANRNQGAEAPSPERRAPRNAAEENWGEAARDGGRGAARDGGRGAAPRPRGRAEGARGDARTGGRGEGARGDARTGGRGEGARGDAAWGGGRGEGARGDARTGGRGEGARGDGARGGGRGEGARGDARTGGRGEGAPRDGRGGREGGARGEGGGGGGARGAGGGAAARGAGGRGAGRGRGR